MKIGTSKFIGDGAPALEYEVQTDVLVLEGPNGEQDRVVIGLVNDSLCVNPLDQVPDASQFDQYLEEWIHAEGTHGYVLIGMATFNVEARKYEIRPGG